MTQWVLPLFKNRPAQNNTQGSIGTSNPTNAFPSATTEGVGEQTQNGTTVFTADADIVEAKVNFRTNLDKLNFSSSSDNYKQEIVDFLAKPVILVSNTFQSTDGVTTFADSYQPRGALNAFPLYSSKLSGYLGFRATQVIRLVVNANPFQQGRYILAAVQMGGACTAKSKLVADMMLNTLVQRTTLPHVEIDLACDSEAVLKVPFLSYQNFYPMNAITGGNDNGCIFRLHLSPYVPISSGTGSSTAGFTIWSHFEDVELIGPAVPQSGRMFSKTMSKSESEKERASVVPVISSTLIKISKAATLFHDVPLLSDYTKSVSWASDILAKTAASFGWSKPNQIAAANRVTRSNMPYATTVDGIDQSQPMSLLQAASVGPAHGFSGTDIDEMDINFIASIPAHRSLISWPSVGAPTGTVLLNRQVSPSQGVSTRIVNSLTYADLTPLQFVCRFFENWRGSIVFNFKLVKTQYHSGRLLVAFAPYSTERGLATTPTIADTNYIHREIIDIRDCNEFSFVVPYISTMPYSTTQDTRFTSATGRLMVFVLEPLVAPDTVNATVTLIEEHCAGPDFEVAIPANPVITPGYGLTPQMGDVFKTGENVCAIGTPFLGGVKGLTYDQNMNSINCIGEKITSFRQLLKVANPLYNSIATPNTPAQYYNVLPYSTSIAVTAVATVFSQLGPDMYSILSSIFLFSRGGVRLKFVVPYTTSLENAIVANLQRLPVGSGTVYSIGAYSTTDATGNSFPALNSGVPAVFEIKSNPVMELQIPQYHRYRVRVNSEQIANPQGAYLYTVADNELVSPIAVSLNLGSAGAASNVTVYRSGADDCNFGTFRAIPPMLYNVFATGTSS